MVMELLGPSIEDLFNSCSRKFGLKTVTTIAFQMVPFLASHPQLARVEYMHGRLLLHRDIKPENFLVGLGTQKTTIYAIDFGLAKKYKDSTTGAHIAYRNNKSLTGTARYASVSTHLGIEQSRRDDLEGLVYVALYLLRGNLPWQGLYARTRQEKYRKIMESKLSTSAESLCKSLPGTPRSPLLGELQTLLSYCRQLKFEEAPNYAHIAQLFRDIARKHSFALDSIFEWTTNPPTLVKIPTLPSNGHKLALPFVSPSSQLATKK
jgi:serine/threonine protein kinase